MSARYRGPEQRWELARSLNKDRRLGAEKLGIVGNFLWNGVVRPNAGIHNNVDTYTYTLRGFGNIVKDFALPFAALGLLQLAENTSNFVFHGLAAIPSLAQNGQWGDIALSVGTTAFLGKKLIDATYDISSVLRYGNHVARTTNETIAQRRQSATPRGDSFGSRV